MNNFANHREKRKGLEREYSVVPQLIKSMETAWNCKASLKHANLNENMRDKVDYHIEYTTPVRTVTITADYKYGISFTLFTNTGTNRLNEYKSKWIILDVPGSPVFRFIKVEALKECVAAHAPELKPSKYPNDNSKWFHLVNYIESHPEFFISGDISIPKIA